MARVMMRLDIHRHLKISKILIKVSRNPICKSILGPVKEHVSRDFSSIFTKSLNPQIKNLAQKKGQGFQSIQA
jgi:hypothetical protein